MLDSYSPKARNAIIAVGIIALIGVGWVTWWLASPLFLDGKKLNEDLSEFDDISTGFNNETSTETGTNTNTNTNTDMTTDSEPLPEFLLRAQGSFVVIDGAHFGSGTVRVVEETATGHLTLVFINVDIANGPDLVVYLSSKDTFSGTSDSAGGTIKDLGDLKANIGNFTMDIGYGVNLNFYNSVLIWCDPFEVVFTFATLTKY